MADFIHCNKCYSRFQKNRKFYLISCGHLNCEICVNTIKENKKCNICGKPCNVLLLTNDIDQNTQQFFVPFEVTLKKTLQIYEFQLHQKSRLFDVMANKYTYAKKECLHYANVNKKLLRENQWLKSVLKGGNSGMGKPVAFSSSTPLNCGSSITDLGDNSISTIEHKGNFEFTPASSRNVTQQSFNLHQRHAPRPGHAGRLFDYTKFQRPSPSQIVPKSLVNNVPVHRPNAMNSLDFLRKAGNM